MKRKLTKEEIISALETLTALELAELRLELAEISGALREKSDFCDDDARYIVRGWANVCGVEIRITDVMSEEAIGVNDGHCLVLFWKGAEIGRITPHYPMTEARYDLREVDMIDSILQSGAG